jgi:copper chaperone
MRSEEMLKLKVAGMTCGGCVKSVERAIAAAAPGATVTIDLKSGEVMVDGAASRQDVVSAIEDAGYDVVGAAA